MQCLYLYSTQLQVKCLYNNKKIFTYYYSILQSTQHLQEELEPLGLHLLHHCLKAKLKT